MGFELPAGPHRAIRLSLNAHLNIVHPKPPAMSSHVISKLEGATAFIDSSNDPNSILRVVVLPRAKLHHCLEPCHPHPTVVPCCTINKNATAGRPSSGQ